jgi:2-polyprenyl-3-methyl-5-hydroxy-6-metoxy-1,4-benzoquinol methylase
MSESKRSIVSKRIEEYAAGVYLEDTTGENFIENTIHSTNLPQLLKHISDAGLRKPILEMGFGEGTITEPLVRAGLAVEIVEGSAKLCDSAVQKFGDKVKVHCSFFEDFQPSEPFETVLALHVLEHVDNPVEVLKNVFNWLAPGGQVIAVVPNAESFHRQLAVMMGLQEELDSLSPRDKIVGHQRVMNLKQLSSVFERAGFEVTTEFGYFLKVVPNSMMTGWSKDLIKSLTLISDRIEPRYAANIGVVVRRP